MALRLIYGSSSKALRETCLQEVIAWTGRWPDRRAIVLVPEQAKLDFEQAYLQLAPQGGLLMAEILSFRRLATRLGSEIGLCFPRQINQAGQAMLLYRILQDQKDHLQLYASLADKPGFVREIAAVLGDLRRSQVDAMTLADLAPKVPDIALRQKINDLAILQQAYAEASQHLGLSDADGALDQLASWLLSPPNPLAERLNWLAQTTVWVVGFGETRNFTPQEFAVLEALNRRTAQLNVTVLADALPADAQAAEQAEASFLIGRRTAWSLVRRFAPPATLAVTATGHQPHVRLVQAARPEDQVTWLAGEIRRLVQTGAIRYRDINIAVCRPAEDLPRVQVAFNQFQIPLFLDQVRTLSGTALMRTVLGLLDIARDGWTRQPVMRLLRAGLFTQAAVAVDELENELLARGLFRFDRLLEEKQALFGPLADSVSALRSAQSVKARIAALKQALETLSLQANCQARIAELASAGNLESALTLAKSWNALLATLDQLDQLAGDSPISLDAFRGLLAAGLDNADSGVLPTALDQVAIGNLARSRQRSCKILFLLGADSASLPPAAPPEGLLKDFDRESLSHHLGQPLPNQARDQVFADAALIHGLFTQPDEQLVVLAPIEAPSPYFVRLVEQHALQPEVLPEQPSAGDVRLSAPQPALNRLLQFSREPLADPDQETGFQALAAALIRLGVPLQQAQRWLLQDDPLTVQLDPDLVTERFGRELNLSVSQLEKYAECPFRHLAAYGLRLTERERFEPEPAAAGTLLHAITEQSLQHLLAILGEGQDLATASRLIQTWLDGELDHLLSDVLQAVRTQPELQSFFVPGLHAAIGRRLERVARTSLAALLRQLLAGEYQPVVFEWAFGNTRDTTSSDQGSALDVVIDDTHRVRLSGKIDRVDQAVDQTEHPEDLGANFRIIDYKSGNQQVDYEKLYHGLALQLPAYLAAYAQNHPGQMAADACYFHFDEPVFTVKEQRPLSAEALAEQLAKHFKLRSLALTPDQLQLLQQHVTNRIRQWAGAMLAGEFSARPRQVRGGRRACETCTYQALCQTALKGSDVQFFDGLAGFNAAGKKLTKKDALLDRLQTEANHATD